MTEPTPFAPGVTLRHERICDVYIGTADSLVAAGVVEERQLPGRPGNSPSMATFHSDGTKAVRGKNRPDDAGKKTIHARRLNGVTVFEVSVRLSKEVRAAAATPVPAPSSGAAGVWPFKDRFDAGSRGRT
jgi:hypothetical protein